MGLRVTPIDHFGEAAAGGSRAGVRELRGADCAGPGQRQHRADWTFADESAHPDSALEWWFLQGLVDGEHSGRVYFMLSLFRHRLETGTDDPDHGHGLLLSVLEPTAGNHRVASWVDEPAVHSVVGRPGLPSLTNLDRRLSVAFIDEVHRNGPLRGTTQTASPPSFGNRPLTVSWSSLEIEQRSDAIDLSFAEPGTNRPWRMRLVPAGHRAALDAVRGIGKHGHSMEVITYPRLTVRGSVGDDAVDGTAWFDHQWGDRGWFFSGGDSGRVLGWEWLGINLDDGRDMIIGVHRDAETGEVTESHVSVCDDGRIEQCTGGVDMAPIRRWQSPRTGIRHAVSWRVRVPAAAIDLRFDPVADDQEVPVFGLARAIWEGAGRVAGTFRGRPVAGRARGEFFGDGYVFDFKTHLEEMRGRIDGHIENFIPPSLEASDVEAYIGPPRWRYEPEAYAQMLTDPTWDLISRRGKRWRPLFGLLMLDAFGGDVSAYEELVSVMAELLHTGGLIIDDIQDRSLLRRGDDCIHLRYGDDVAISAANTLYFLPSVLVSAHPLLTEPQRLALHETTARQMLSAHFGQALDLYWSRNMDRENLRRWVGDSLEAKILQMYAQKTSAPLVALATISSVLADVDQTTKTACIDFARNFGVGYQILDDIQNFSTSPEWRKTCGEDLAEGKVTMVLCAALRRLKDNDREVLQEIVCAPEVRRSPEGLAEGIDLIRRSGALEACRSQASQIVEDSWCDVSDHLEPSESKILLRTLWGALLDQEIPV